MLMGGHKPPQDVVDFAKRARAADGLAGQVSRHHHASFGGCSQSGMYQAKGICAQAAIPMQHHMPLNLNLSSQHVACRCKFL